MSRASRLLLVGGLVLVLLFTVVRVWVSLSHYSAVDATAGVWTTLALDLSQGTFYRPLYGELGFGGTRYFPLFFVLQGLLIALGVPALPAGLLLGLLSVGALAAAVFVLLRRLGVPRLFALAGSVLLLVSTATQLAITTVRGDALATALVVFGLSRCTGERDRDAWIAAVPFTLAFATKITALYGAAAGVLGLLWTGRRGGALRVAAGTGVGVALTLGLMHLASGGRVFGIMAACGSAGSDLEDMLEGPSRLIYFMTHLDTGALLTFFLAAIAFLAMDARQRFGPTGMLLLGATGAVAVIYGSPGTNYNQLIDVQAASLVVFIAWACGGGGRRRELAATALTALALISMHPLLSHLRNVDSAPLREGFAGAVEVVRDIEGPIVSENPVVPIMAGHTPWVLDPYMLRVLADTDPGFAQPLHDALAERRVGAVVLSHADPRSVWGARRFRRDIFGEGFVEMLERHYYLAHEVEGQLVYLPRSP